VKAHLKKRKGQTKEKLKKTKLLDVLAFYRSVQLLLSPRAPFFLQIHSQVMSKHVILGMEPG
jgi:hypothetical protein